MEAEDLLCLAAAEDVLVLLEERSQERKAHAETPDEEWSPDRKLEILFVAARMLVEKYLPADQEEEDDSDCSPAGPVD